MSPRRQRPFQVSSPGDDCGRGPGHRDRAVAGRARCDGQGATAPGTGFDIAGAMWRLTHPADVGGWLTIVGILTFAIIGGMFIAAMRVRRARSSLESLFASVLRSATNSSIARWRSSPVCARSTDDGCTVAITSGASGDSTNFPLSVDTLNVEPRSAWAAVAPRHTSARGLTTRTRSRATAARANLGDARLDVNATLAPRFPFEMLHDVGHIDLIARDTGCLERLVEHASRGPDERLSRQIFCIARLFADEHHSGISSTFTKDRLRRISIQVAAGACRGRLPSRAKRRSGGNKPRC